MPLLDQIWALTALILFGNFFASGVYGGVPLLIDSIGRRAPVDASKAMAVITVSCLMLYAFIQSETWSDLSFSAAALLPAAGSAAALTFLFLYGVWLFEKSEEECDHLDLRYWASAPLMTIPWGVALVGFVKYLY